MMTEPIDFAERSRTEDVPEPDATTKDPGSPSNEVYARVGDVVLLAARDGVRRGLTPQDIIREILITHKVHLNVGELRLLLASRRV
jgi:hypothetical protein